MKYVSHSDRVTAEIRARTIVALARTGFGAEAQVKRGMPVETGFARRSTHALVIDEQGRPVDGSGSDDNGNPVPRYPATGRLTSVVGSNTGYVRYIRRKGSGAGGASVTVPLFAAALDAGAARLPDELARAMRGGGGR